MNNRHLKIGTILLSILILAGLIALASWYSKPMKAEAFIKSEIVNAGYEK